MNASTASPSYVRVNLGQAAKLFWDVLTLVVFIAYFLLVAFAMLFSRRLTPKVGLGRFALGIFHRRSQRSAMIDRC